LGECGASIFRVKEHKKASITLYAVTTEDITILIDVSGQRTASIVRIKEHPKKVSTMLHGINPGNSIHPDIDMRGQAVEQRQLQEQSLCL
jgi:hypothetical protein